MAGPPFKGENDYAAEIQNARAYSQLVPANIIKAIIATESEWKPQAIRGEPHRGDASRGLMQLLLSTARAEGFTAEPDQLFHPAVNIFFGAKHLQRLFQRLQNWDDVISAYNGGIRPHLGFGGRAPAPVRVCLARHQESGQCIRWHQNPGAEYSNREYVEKVRRYLTYYAKGELPPSGRAAAWGVGALVTLGFLGLALARALRPS